MTLRRIIANVLVAVVLAAVLFGLVAVIVDERCSRAVSMADPKPMVQDIPFKE
jgi:predicted DNA repair protein MutK